MCLHPYIAKRMKARHLRYLRHLRAHFFRKIMHANLFLKRSNLCEKSSMQTPQMTQISMVVRTNYNH